MQHNLTLSLIQSLLRSPSRALNDLNRFGLSPSPAAPNWSVAHLPGESWYRRLRIFDQGGEPLSYLFCEPTAAHSRSDIEAAMAPMPFLPDLESVQLDTPEGLIFMADLQDEARGVERPVRLRLELDGDRVSQITLEFLPSTEDCAAAAEALGL